MFVELNKSGDQGVFFSSGDKFQQTIIEGLETSDCAYISGVQLINYESQEEETLASNWRVDPNKTFYQKLGILSLITLGVILLYGSILSCCGLAISSNSVNFMLSASLIFTVPVGINCFGWGIVSAYWLKSGERRAKRILESEEKLIKHFNRLTTASFDEVYNKYCYTESQADSRLEALVYAHLLTRSEGDYLYRLFNIQSNPRATEEEKKVLELAKASWTGQQAIFEIAKLNHLPRFDYLDAPRTDTRVQEDPLVLIDKVLPVDKQLSQPIFTLLPKA